MTLISAANQLAGLKAAHPNRRLLFVRVQEGNALLIREAFEYWKIDKTLPGDSRGLLQY